MICFVSFVIFIGKGSITPFTLTPSQGEGCTPHFCLEFSANFLGKISFLWGAFKKWKKLCICPKRIPTFYWNFPKTKIALELSINVMRHTIHKWGGNISSIHFIILWVNTSLWFLNSLNSLKFLNSLSFELFEFWTLLILNSRVYTATFNSLVFGLEEWSYLN